MTDRITNDILIATFAEFQRCAYNISEAARCLNLGRGTVADRLNRAYFLGLAKKPNIKMASKIIHVRPKKPEYKLNLGAFDIPLIPDHVETRNAAFWQNKYKETAKALADASHKLREVSGMMSRDANPPEWSLPQRGITKRAAGLLHISDIHGGEVVKGAQIDGINEYNPDICRTRIRRLFSAAIDILPRWSVDCELEGVIVAINGDLISGDIHEELIRTNALASIPSATFVADELCAGLEKLVDKFRSIYVCVTPGNHGRTTQKMPSKDTAALSYDTLVGELIHRHFKDDSRVVVAVSPSRDATYRVFNWNILQTHHDQGGGGGQGWAGPVLPIIRKGKQIEFMSAQRGITYDIILTAHHHVSCKAGKVLANGSMIGFNEYASSIRAAPEPPQQWLCLIHEQWGVREMLEVKLEDPRPSPKPHIVLRASTNYAC